MAIISATAALGFAAGAAAVSILATVLPQADFSIVEDFFEDTGKFFEGIFNIETQGVSFSNGITFTKPKPINLTREQVFNLGLTEDEAKKLWDDITKYNNGLKAISFSDGISIKTTKNGSFNIVVIGNTELSFFGNTKKDGLTVDQWAERLNILFPFLQFTIEQVGRTTKGIIITSITETFTTPNVDVINGIIDEATKGVDDKNQEITEENERTELEVSSVVTTPQTPNGVVVDVVTGSGTGSNSGDENVKLPLPWLTALERILRALTGSNTMTRTITRTQTRSKSKSGRAWRIPYRFGSNDDDEENDTKKIKSIYFNSSRNSEWIKSIKFVFPTRKGKNSNEKGTMIFELKSGGQITKHRVKRGTFSVIVLWSIGTKLGVGYRYWSQFNRRAIVNRDRVLSWTIPLIKASERKLAIRNERKLNMIKYT